MDESKETLCNLWNIEEFEVQQHSRLYHLAPIGVGGPLVESLTSYLTRLADAHCVYPRVLLAKEILPVWRLPSLYQNNQLIYQHLTSFWKDSSYLNSTADTANGLLLALEQLTLRRDLYYLTMLPFKEVLSYRNLMRHTRAWCPVCYEQWREANQMIYEPLLWTLQAILVCPWHRCLLQLRCPNCANTLRPLDAHSQSGYCSHCGQWLGGYLSSDTASVIISEEEWIWYRWIGNAVGQLLATAPNLPPLSRNIIATVITSYINDDIKNGGSRTALAQRLQMTEPAVAGWQKGKRIPQLDTLLQTCVCLGLSPLDFLTGNVLNNSISQIKRPQVPVLRKSSHGHRWMNKEELQNALEKVLRDEEDPSPCMKEVALRLGYGPVQLQKVFPDLCRAISLRYSAYKAKKRLERIERMRADMRGVIQTILIQGGYPSYWRIEKSLGHGIFKDPRITQIRQQILQEFSEKQEGYLQ